jgi:NAD(P)-dependent dehydrogenase (short-subunit alcohol dehydrogenase family)
LHPDNESANRKTSRIAARGDVAMDLQLVGKTALVSGSTAGIGLAIASGLAQEGATVYVNGRTEARVKQAMAQVEAAKAQVKQTQGTVEGITADLGSVEGCVELFSQLPNVGSSARFSSRPATKAGWPIQARFWLEWDSTELDR